MTSCFIAYSCPRVVLDDSLDKCNTHVFRIASTIQPCYSGSVHGHANYKYCCRRKQTTVSSQLALLTLPQVARLRGGIKRATVKTDEEDDDVDEDEEDGGAGIVSALKGNIKDVGPPQTLQYGCSGLSRDKRSTYLLQDE